MPNELIGPTPSDSPTCQLCGDTDAVMFLRARCHPTAPLRAELHHNILTLSCYLPDCGREVVRMTIVRVHS